MAQAPFQNSPHSSPLREGKDLSKAAVAWTIVLIAGVSFAAASAFKDSQNRGVLEKAVERTAVGDRKWFPLDATPLPPLLFDGAPLTPAAKQPETMAEVSMRRKRRDGRPVLVRQNGAGPVPAADPLRQGPDGLGTERRRGGA